ncbi:predicted protein [Uncinocarpus reesii 1704]|uniref:Uncharacterized protein n=1 Tax=Uncinocarpus reesii (strain UAMH 1704) TaxID=336963 RepID=C4JRK0_UNCRE|nr:uncharacterized protein UREG_05089 [Uncinocarpus reesii 1704]EEP80247.1 predicted protein [Uncinocarpus reesii 1704]
MAFHVIVPVNPRPRVPSSILQYLRKYLNYTFLEEDPDIRRLKAMSPVHLWDQNYVLTRESPRPALNMHPPQPERLATGLVVVRQDTGDYWEIGHRGPAPAFSERDSGDILTRRKLGVPPSGTVACIFSKTSRLKKFSPVGQDPSFVLYENILTRFYIAGVTASTHSTELYIMLEFIPVTLRSNSQLMTWLEGFEALKQSLKGLALLHEADFRTEISDQGPSVLCRTIISR